MLNPDTPELPVGSHALVLALRLLAEVAEQTDIRIQLNHTGRVQLYDFGANDDDFEADNLRPEAAAKKLQAAMADRSDVIIGQNASNETPTDDQSPAPAVSALRDAAEDSALLEVGRRAIEDALIDSRDSRLSEPFRGNGLVVREKDGGDSSIIRFGPETALRIGLTAMADHLAQNAGSDTRRADARIQEGG